MRKFRLVNNDVLGGVCGGIAYFFGIPTWIPRLLWFIWFVTAQAGDGTSWLIYVLLWIVIPRWDKDPDDFKEVTG